MVWAGLACTGDEVVVGWGWPCGAIALAPKAGGAGAFVVEHARAFGVSMSPGGMVWVVGGGVVRGGLVVRMLWVVVCRVL